MRILVMGASRSGTSLIREVVKGLGIVKWHPEEKEEDRKFFKYKRLPENYGTKVATHNGITVENITGMMGRHEDLRIVFSVRHPVDICMSKIVRGQSASGGGDRRPRIEKVNVDATVDGAIVAVKYSLDVHKAIIKRFPGRTCTVRMESLISMPEKEVTRVASFFGVEPTEQSLMFFAYNTNKYQRARYGDRLDKNQIGLNEKWDTAFGGYFRKRKEDINRIKKAFSLAED